MSHIYHTCIPHIPTYIFHISSLPPIIYTTHTYTIHSHALQTYSNTYRHHTLPHTHTPLLTPILHVHTIYNTTYCIHLTRTIHTVRISQTLYIYMLSHHILTETHYNMYSPTLHTTQAYPKTYTPTPYANNTPISHIGYLITTCLYRTLCPGWGHLEVQLTMGIWDKTCSTLVLSLPSWWSWALDK